MLKASLQLRSHLFPELMLVMLEQPMDSPHLMTHEETQQLPTTIIIGGNDSKSVDVGSTNKSCIPKWSLSLRMLGG